jgi:hypothetical protein
VLANLDLRTRFREHLVVAAWPQIAGKVVSAHSRAETVRDGVLIVATDTPAWAQELHMRRAQLLQRVAEQVGQGLITEIHFRSGGRTRRKAGPPRQPRPAEMKLSRRQEQQIAEAAASIADPGLRSRAERAFLALARMSEWRRETGWRRCSRCGRWQKVGRRWCASCLHGASRRRRR